MHTRNDGSSKHTTLGNHGGELSLEKVHDNKKKGECNSYGWFVRQLLILRVRREAGVYLLVELQHEVDEVEDVRAASFGHGEDGSLIVDCFVLCWNGWG